jgi:thiosulfate/3-mercaptopyruvate sulfurtransferase
MQAVLPLARRRALFAAALGAVFLVSVLAWPSQRAGAEAVTPLVDVAWLLENNGRVDLVVLDVRNELDGGSEAGYRAGHVPGAVYSNYLKSGWRTERDGVPAQLPLVATLEALIGELGIGNESHVVIVAAGSGTLDMASATRVYWTFKVLGHDRVSILDGGYRAYTADPANPVEIGWVTPLPNIFSADFRPELIADRAAVAAAAAAGGLLVDNRPREYFLGRKQHSWATRAGTIPGAVWLPDSSFLDREGRFVRAERLEELLRRTGLSTAGEEQIIVFCNTGHWSTLGWFAQSEILGRKNVRVYDGSMVDWTAETARTVQLGRAAAQ